MTLDDFDAPGIDSQLLTNLIHTLRETVEHARAMPMSSSAIVHRGEVLELLDRIEKAVPDQISRADELLHGAASDRQRAQNDAQDVIDAAQLHASALIEQHAIVAGAQSRAQEIITQAQTQAATLKAETEQYCERRLALFETDLTKLVEQVRAGRSRLASGLNT